MPQHDAGRGNVPCLDPPFARTACPHASTSAWRYALKLKVAHHMFTCLTSERHSLWKPVLCAVLQVKQVQDLFDAFSDMRGQGKAKCSSAQILLTPNSLEVHLLALR